MAIIGTIYPSSLFQFHHGLNRFTAEISEVPTVLRQLWSTSMDLGFRMRSMKTGEIAFFTLTDAHRNEDFEYEYWTFEPTEDSIRRNPRLHGVTVRIYND